MPLPPRRRAVYLAVCVALIIALSGARTWQVGALGAGCLAVGLGVIAARRRQARR